MRSIDSYKSELAQAEAELNSITVKKSTKGVYDYDRGDVAVSNVGYEEYLDKNRARMLKEKIADLRDKINNYAIYAQSEQEGLEKQKRLDKEATDRYVQSSARQLYEKAQNEFHSKSLIGKVGSLFSGKKPKKNMTEEQIQARYGEEAKRQFETDGLQAKIAELEQEKAQQIEWTRNNVPPEKAQQRIWYFEDYYDKQIAELKQQAALVGKGR